MNIPIVGISGNNHLIVVCVLKYVAAHPGSVIGADIAELEKNEPRIVAARRNIMP